MHRLSLHNGSQHADFLSRHTQRLCFSLPFLGPETLILSHHPRKELFRRSIPIKLVGVRYKKSEEVIVCKPELGCTAFVIQDIDDRQRVSFDLGSDQAAEFRFETDILKA